MPFPIAAVLAIASAVSGAAKAAKGSAQQREGQDAADKLLKLRQAYKTPAELYKVLQATEYNAQSGFDPTTLQYLTNQTDRTFDSVLDTQKILGGDPNDFSALFDNKMQALLKIGEQNHQLNTENFSRYLSAEQMIASSKDAEYQSSQNLIKDQQQTAAGNIAAGAQEKTNGFNTIINAAANYATENLYKESEKGMFNDTYGSQGASANRYAKKNNLSFNEYNSKATRIGDKLAKSFLY